MLLYSLRDNSVVRRKAQKNIIQWLICQLHLNELQLCHLFKAIDGSTAGSNTFNGVNGKQLINVTTLKIVNYAIIPTNLPSKLENLSKDQQYLYIRYMRSYINRKYDTKFKEKKNSGFMSHARWLTTANRILRLYIGTKRPTHNLKLLTTFIIKMYAPIWFRIKSNSKCFNGDVNFHQIIILSRNLSDSLRSIVDDVLQRNCYFAHCENVLLAMMKDEDREIRKKAAEIILRYVLKILIEIYIYFNSCIVEYKDILIIFLKMSTNREVLGNVFLSCRK